MFKRKRYADYEELYENEEDSKITNKRVRPWLFVSLTLGALLLVGGVATLLTTGNGLRLLRESPKTTAKTWFEAMWALEGEAVLDRTCDQEIWVSNAVNGGTSIAALLSYLGVPAAEGIDIDLTELSEQLQVDISRLTYEEEDTGDIYAVVAVTGQMRFEVFGGVFPYRLNETWQMVWEDDRWKWCGRQETTQP